MFEEMLFLSHGFRERESDRAIPWANISGFRRSRAEPSEPETDSGGSVAATDGEEGKSASESEAVEQFAFCD